jgi:hypothetical protein
VLRRLSTTALLALVMLFVLAAPVLAHDGGQGLYGETTDINVTNAGFIVIIFFPLFVFVVSMIQWRLEVRKSRRKAAAKARTKGGAWQGGW